MRRDRGFTLLEIMITLAIIGAISGIIMVNMSGVTRNERLRSAARKLSGLSDYVRSQATGAKSTCYIEFDFIHNRYRWRSEPARDSMGRYIDIEDGHVLSEVEIEEWVASFDWEDLPRDVYFRRLYQSAKRFFDQRHGVVTATYYPDGKVESYILWIQGAAEDGKQGDSYSIVVNGLTGKSEVLDGSVTPLEAEESNFSSVMGKDAPGGKGEPAPGRGSDK